MAEARIRRIIEAIETPGSNAVLVGERGCGKSTLAFEAASAFASSRADEIDLVVVDRPGEFAAALATLSAQRETVVVALGVDDYDDAETELLEHLALSPRVRVIGTARHLSGAADRISRNRSVRQLAISPLDREETEQLLASLFGVERVSPKTVARWHRATKGNQHALVTLALAAERRGDVRRSRNIAWVPSRLDGAPHDFVAQLGELGEREWEALELVSFAESLWEPELLRLLDGAAVSALIERQILVVSTESDGRATLSTRLPIIASAIRSGISPLRRVELAARCFTSLDSDEADQFTTLTASGRKRIVRFGIEGGCPVPVDWVWQALRASSRSTDLPFVLRLALVAMHHENPQRSAEAISRVIELGHFLGDRAALTEGLDALAELFSDEARLAELTRSTLLGLVGLSINFDPYTATNPDYALAAIERWVAWAATRGVDMSEFGRAGSLSALALAGRLGEAFEAGAGAASRHELEGEWIATQARSFEAMLRIQRGEFRAALALAESTRQAVLLHDIPPTIVGDLESFAIFLAHWARGTTLSTRHTVDTIELPGGGDPGATQTQSSLVDVTIALSAVQEARWFDAASLAEGVIAALAENDPFGLSPLAHGIAALAHAALGENERAQEELMRSGATGRGISRVVGGIVGLLALRARHWLRDPELVEVSLRLADWAAEEGLALVELEALDVYAHETRTDDPQLLARVERVAALVDPPIGATILAHVQSLTNSEGATITVEERLLSELGLWLPLPPVEHLTGREREIALFTALGYPSKHVADHLHLSARTVETHLARVYGKLGLSGREELRAWFSRRRETAWQ